MQMPQDRFRGLFIPHVTPFDESGALDTGSLERLTTHFRCPERRCRIGILRPHRRRAGAERSG